MKKGSHHTPEQRRKVTEGLKRYFRKHPHPPLSPLHRERIAKANTGKRISEEAKQKMRDAKKRFFARGGKPSRLGSKSSDETKKKIGDSMKTQYTLGRVPPNPKGVNFSPEYRKKLSKSRQRYFSEGGDRREGPKASNWKGGRYITKQGYVVVYHPEHPNCLQGRHHILEHRLKMSQHLGRALKRTEGVHHKNGNKTDNRLCNLQIVLPTTHHGKVRCPFCLKHFLIR